MEDVKVLKKLTRDDWGMQFPPGAEIIRGYFFNLLKHLRVTPVSIN